METDLKFNFKGIDAILEVYSDRIEIKPNGVFGLLDNQGNETILIKNLTSVEVRECSFIKGGHIQFSANGTNEKNNKITFGGFGDRNGMNENANKIKTFVVKQMNTPSISTDEPTSTSDELFKLSSLKDSGVITDDEFQMAKKKFLGI